MKTRLEKTIHYIEKNNSLVFGIISAGFTVFSFIFPKTIEIRAFLIPVIIIIPFWVFMYYRHNYVLKSKYKGGEVVQLKGSRERLFVVKYEWLSKTEVICKNIKGDIFTYHENSLEDFSEDDDNAAPIYFSNRRNNPNRW